VTSEPTLGLGQPVTPGSRLREVTRGFLYGGMAAFICSLVLPAAFEMTRAAAPLPRIVSALLWDLPAPLSLAIGGVLAGRALDRGTRGSVATGLAMFVAASIQFLALGDVGRLTGREDPILVVTLTITASAAGFACGGAVAGTLLGLRTPQRRSVTGGFAGASLPSSLAALVVFFLAHVGAGAAVGPLFPLALLLCQAAGVVGPFLVCGAALGRALEQSPA